MKNIFLWIWQFPQNILGLIVIKITKAKYTECFYGIMDLSFYRTKYNMGVSLGKYRIIKDTCNYDILKHEYGHTLQSHRLGIFYLFSVGIVSISRNIWDRIFHKKWKKAKRIEWYYGSWPEKQADKLGGVIRYEMV